MVWENVRLSEVVHEYTVSLGRAKPAMVQEASAM